MSSSSLTPDSGSELSELSDVESAELEKKLFSKNKGRLDSWLQGSTDGASSPPPKRKREPSPPHDYVLADNQDIAFLVMFRARFSAAFPRFVPNFGPQDIESSVIGTPPGEVTEKLLCALLGLVLNRKKDIGLGHYGRALEDAIVSNKHQWPRSWEKSPISGDGSFNNMSPEQRLNLLKTLVLWALNSSEAIQTIIKDSYKQNRHDDDLNQPLSVQPWGRDGDKRRYWLVEGQDDTYFRLYRESNPVLKTNTWWSVAGSIPEIKTIATKLQEEGTQAAKRLSDRIEIAVPRFEAGEEKRKRREYRIARKMQFTRPEPGFSLYEGRTRGKRIKYTFSDDEDATSDAYSARRSTRNATPMEPAGPTVTASGRQVRSRLGGMYGESLLSGQAGQGDGISDAADIDTDGPGDSTNLRTRSGRLSGGRRQTGGAGSDDESDAASSGNEWQGNEDDDADDETDGDLEMDDEDEIANGEDVGSPQSLVVKLRVGAKEQTLPQSSQPTSQTGTGTMTPMQNQINGMQIATPPSEPNTSVNANGFEPTNGTAVHHEATDQNKPMTLGMPKPEPTSPHPFHITPKSETASKERGAENGGLNGQSGTANGEMSTEPVSPITKNGAEQNTTVGPAAADVSMSG